MVVTMLSSASCSLAMSCKNQIALLLSSTSCFKSNSSKMRLSSRVGSAKTSFKFYNNTSVAQKKMMFSDLKAIQESDKIKR